MKRWLLIPAACATLAVHASAQTPAPLRGFDAYVQQVMTQWQVPGLAVAIVKDGKVVLARGYGVRELGKPDAVDANTLFDIGSNTKAFTAAALGTLVSAKKLDWDARVVDYVPHFQLSSPYVTQAITLEDLLTHRSGYCDPPMWYMSNDDDVFARLQYQQPDYGFRAQFCYNNMLYLTAARFIPAVTGESWNRYIAQHLFAPLGMDRTVTTEAQLEASHDVAMPHGMVDGKVSVIQRYWPHNMDIVSPVGGINSSATEMSHWMLMLLAGGRYDGQQVLQASTVRAMETPRMLVAASSGVGREIRAWVPGGTFYTYGLGLFVQDYAGHTLVWHAGDIDGMASAMALMPDEHLGITVMSNMTGDESRFAIVERVLHAYLGLAPGGLSDTLLAENQRVQRAVRANADKLAATRDVGGHPPVALARYAATYHDDFDGTARVTMEDGHLVLRLGNPNFTGDLAYWHGNTFRVTWRYHFYGTAYVTFDVNALGEPVRVSLAQSPLHFERAPAAGR